MELDELISRVEKFLPLIQEEMVANFIIAGNDAVDTIVTRLQESGLADDGSDFDLYTPEYLKKKQKLGRYRGFRDHTLSGDMLRSLKARLEEDGEGVAIVIGVAENQKKKLQGNVNTVGKQLIRMSDFEVQQIRDDVRVRTEEMLLKYLKR